MNKTVRYILYFVILAICIMAVFIGVYNMELAKAEKESEILNNQTEVSIINETETTADKFIDLFSNDFFSSNYNESKISKLYTDRPLVFAESQNTEKDGQYKIDAYLPIININSETAIKYNNDTIANFGERAKTLMNSPTTKGYTIYDTSFTGYINNNILSVAIMGSIKEGNNAQRVLIKSYNYNLDTGKEVPISEVLSQKGIDPTLVNNKIKTEIKEAIEHAEIVSQTGYEVYKRNTDDEMYDVKNVNNYIIGPEGIIYIVYAYGNTNNTSEMDVIEVGYEANQNN